MKQKLDLETWNRKEHFMFFKQLEEPFFGLTTVIDCTIAYENTKKLGISFFEYYLHKTLFAANELENFKYRIIDDEVYIFDKINASATIMRKDKTFGFSHIEFDKDLKNFSENTLKEIDRVRNTTGLFTREFPFINLIHFSTIPWINFTSLSHARSFTFSDSCPKITFGKMTVSKSGKRKMPISIHVHHGLVDGYHVGEFITLFQKLMNQ